MTEQLPLIAAIVPTQSQPELIRNCLAALSDDYQLGPKLEVWIVQNESGNEGPSVRDALPRDLPFQIRWLALEKSGGTTASINEAIHASRSKYVLLLNNDVQLTPRSLQILAAFLENQTSVAFAGPKLIAARDPSHLDGAGDAMLMGGGAYRLGHQDIDSGQFQEQRGVLAGCGAALLA